MVVIAGTDYEARVVDRVVAGFAFGTKRLKFTPPRGPAFLPMPADQSTPRWAYRSYDCVPASDGGIDDRDILVIDGLNAKLTAEPFLAIKSVAGDVSTALANIPTNARFWELDASDVDGAPPEDSIGWWMHRAWWLLMGLPRVNIAITHKLLHHKRPTVFALFDRVTRRAYDKDQLWRGVYTDLRQSAKEWEGIEQRFAALAETNGGVALSRLRMHDIVLWCRRIDDWQLACAEAAGAKILDRQGAVGEC